MNVPRKLHTHISVVEGKMSSSTVVGRIRLRIDLEVEGQTHTRIVDVAIDTTNPDNMVTVRDVDGDVPPD